jgi:hypothetical protein
LDAVRDKREGAKQSGAHGSCLVQCNLHEATRASIASDTARGGDVSDSAAEKFRAFTSRETFAASRYGKSFLVSEILDARSAF